MVLCKTLYEGVWFLVGPKRVLLWCCPDVRLGAVYTEPCTSQPESAFLHTESSSRMLMVFIVLHRTSVFTEEPLFVAVVVNQHLMNH